MIVTQSFDQFERSALCEGLAARDLNQRTAKVAHNFHDLVDRSVHSAAERVFAITPRAAHGTAGQPHKGARSARVGRLSLDRAKDFGDAKHAAILDSRLRIVD